MKARLSSVTIIIIFVLICVFAFLKLNSLSFKVTIVTDKLIFSQVNNDNFIGEGFFVTLQNGNELFIYSTPENNPHDIENSRRKFFAIAKGNGWFKLPLIKTIRMFLLPKTVRLNLASKYDLGMEHQVLSADIYRALAEEVRKKGYYKKVCIVYFKDITFSKNEVKISCKDITGIDKLTMTTGGSVFVLTVNTKDGKALNIGISTQNPNAESELLNLLEKIKNLVGTDKVIIAKNVSYQDAIYTFKGVRSGWVVNISDVSVE